MATGMGEVEDMLRPDWRKCFRVRCIDARRMAKPTGADPRTAGRIGSDVKDDVIRTGWVAGDPANSRQVIELEIISHAP